ncbi:hypothetical protein ACHHYP_05328 [Achlya hypogyna]|uniref:PH domain-containing protein n=1 Tax=Achlya hypogyna TaxID=1202772 RepID=A0A1V9YY30_ACHHY|nr:hypothetical protein ACHHYP_05328 [Achlya hypogyna]
MTSIASYTSNVEMQAKHWLGFTTWKFQNWTLRGAALTVAHASCLKRDAESTFKYTVRSGGVWSAHQWGLCVSTVEAGNLYAVATTKTAWAMWLSVLHTLDMNTTKPLRASPTLSAETISSCDEDDEDEDKTPSPILKRPRSQPTLTKKVSFSSDIRVREIESRPPTDAELNASFALQAAIFSC